MLIFSFIRKVTDEEENDSDDELKRSRMVRYSVLQFGTPVIILSFVDTIKLVLCA
jgi:hypothetical protein